MPRGRLRRRAPSLNVVPSETMPCAFEHTGQAHRDTGVGRGCLLGRVGQRVVEIGRETVRRTGERARTARPFPSTDELRDQVPRRVACDTLPPVEEGVSPGGVGARGRVGGEVPSSVEAGERLAGLIGVRSVPRIAGRCARRAGHGHAEERLQGARRDGLPVGVEEVPPRDDRTRLLYNCNQTPTAASPRG